MTQPPHWQPSEYSPQPSAQYGQQPRYGQPQYGQQPRYGQPQYGQPPHVAPTYPQQPPFYGPGPYPPPPPPNRSNRTVILSIIGVLVIAGGAVAAILLLTGSNGDKKHTAGPGGVHGTQAPVPGAPTAFPKGGGVQGGTVAALSCTRIKNALIRGGGFTAGSITVSDGGTPPSAGVPQPSGTATTTCTLRPSDPSSAGSIDHIVVIAWRGVTERVFAAQLRSAGYHSTSNAGYTFWGDTGSSRPKVVTATISGQLVTFYLA